VVDDVDQHFQVRQHAAAHENGNLLHDLHAGVTRLWSGGERCGEGDRM
jgi:hypothetical protein